MESTPGGFALSQLQESLRGGTPKKTTFYVIVGVSVLSVAGAALYSYPAPRSERIEQLSAALRDDLRALIARGESANLEFKSSFRWDLKENKVNRALEAVVLENACGIYEWQWRHAAHRSRRRRKSIIGLDRDYTTLKKPDRDGFEQALMTAIAAKLGGDACRTSRRLSFIRWRTRTFAASWSRRRIVRFT